MEKLKPREKVAMYMAVFLIRWLVPRSQLDDETAKLFDAILHELRCNL